MGYKGEMSYSLIDSGDFQKLEAFGPYRFVRPSASAVWKRTLPKEEWSRFDASFYRDRNGEGEWKLNNTRIPDHWDIEVSGLIFRMRLTSFGHTGIFPEQGANWTWLQKNVRPGSKVLNLFAYTGGSTLACAKAGAEVVHLDASKTSVTWARENAELNGLEDAKIRWIVDDVQEFVAKEVRRGNTYQGFILDPPSYGRGTKKQVWKIEKHLMPLLENLKKLAAGDFQFCLLSSHSQGYTPKAHENQLRQIFPVGKYESSEMFLEGAELQLPAGGYALVKAD
jgi:23S rRNA (cytosine1962-C5)-methyltransferase